MAHWPSENTEFRVTFVRMRSRNSSLACWVTSNSSASRECIAVNSRRMCFIWHSIVVKYDSPL